MTDTVNLICNNCRHFDLINGGCAAFPGGIPDSILLSNQHNEEVPGQVPEYLYDPIGEVEDLEEVPVEGEEETFTGDV